MIKASIKKFKTKQTTCRFMYHNTEIIQQPFKKTFYERNSTIMELGLKIKTLSSKQLSSLVLCMLKHCIRVWRNIQYKSKA